jgi:acyl-CoA synthetase (AMP-forming)/AMP-acid ligase II
MYLTQAIHKGRREKAEATAAICGAEQASWSHLAQRVERCAGLLRGLGVAPGDRVGMMGLNSIRYLEYFYGSWWAGAVVNPVNIRWSAHEVAYSLDDCDTRVLFVDDAFAPLVPRLRELSTSLRTVVFCGTGAVPEGALDYEQLLAAATPCGDALRSGSDLAAVMYTGGTTGRPKGVMLSHDNLFINALSNASNVPRQHVKVGMVVTPMFHVAAAAWPCSWDSGWCPRSSCRPSTSWPSWMACSGMPSTNCSWCPP